MNDDIDWIVRPNIWYDAAYKYAEDNIECAEFHIFCSTDGDILWCSYAKSPYTLRNDYNVKTFTKKELIDFTKEYHPKIYKKLTAYILGSRR